MAIVEHSLLAIMNKYYKTNAVLIVIKQKINNQLRKDYALSIRKSPHN
jgi:hypothetical protein